MTIIKQLSEMIEEELEGAEDYAKNAVKHREDNPGLAKVFYDISLDEMRHMNMLHDEVARLITEYRREHGEPPQAMQAVYEYLHERHMEHANEIRMYQAEYKNA